jgi:hypothetical protein
MNQCEEIWKTITVAPKYEVSSFGNIRRVGKSRFRKQKTTRKGYREVTLAYQKGKMKTFRVHRLVAQAFVPNDEPFDEYGYLRDHIDHIDGDKSNNRADNLRWCSNQENTGFYHELHPAERKKKTDIDRERKLRKKNQRMIDEAVKRYYRRTKEEYFNEAAKTVLINGEPIKGIRNAAKMIADKAGCKSETIRKEIQRFVNGRIGTRHDRIVRYGYVIELVP